MDIPISGFEVPSTFYGCVTWGMDAPMSGLEAPSAIRGYKSHASYAAAGEVLRRGDTSVRNVGLRTDYTALYLRKWHISTKNVQHY
jgi:hypothetical protein